MRKMLRRTFLGKVRLGRFGLPVWALGLATVIMAAAAGQAVGPVLSGQINGTAGLVVGQAVILSTDDATAAHDIVGAEDGVIVASDDGTGFTAAVEAFRGQTATIELDLVNEAAQDSAALITINAPSGVTVDVDENAAEADGVEVAQMSRNSWLVTVPSAETDGDADIDLDLTGEPGFFTIQATIVQIAAG